MSEFVRVINDPEEIAERRAAAREEFIRHCERFYGMVPFTEEYLDKCWPT